MEFKMDRNGAGYKDETAYKAFKGMAKAGEIWTVNSNGVEKEVLIIKNHGKHCNVLTLLDECKNNWCIEVKSRSLKYTDPRMMQYLFNENFSQFVKALTGEEFDTVLDDIEDAMGLNIYRADAEDAKDELEAAKNRIKHLEEELEKERNRKVAPAEMAMYKHLYDELIDKLIDKKVL